MPIFSLQRDTDEEVREFLQNNLHLQGKVSEVFVLVILAGVCDLKNSEAPFVVGRLTIRLCAGKWLFTKRWQGRLKMLMLL